MVDWQEYSKYRDLRSVIDPSDTKGYKNHYLDLLHHIVLRVAIGDSIRGKKILDLGCGIGRFNQLLESLGAEVVGVDFCSGMLEVNSNKNTHCASAQSLPFEDGSFDAVLSVWTQQYFSYMELSDVVKEIYRILSPGGLVFLIEQVSELGYGSVYSRLPADYEFAYRKFRRVGGRSILYERDLLVGIIRTGIFPYSSLEMIAPYHLSGNLSLPMKAGEYTDQLMVFRKV